MKKPYNQASFSKRYIAAMPSGYTEDESSFFPTQPCIRMDTDPMGAVSMDTRTPHVVATC